MFQHAAQMVRPFPWNEITRRPHLSTTQRTILDEASDLGLRSGAIVPIHGPGPIKALLSVTNNEQDERFTELFTATRHSLHLLATYAHERMLQLGFGTTAPSLALSSREAEV